MQPLQPLLEEKKNLLQLHWHQYMLEQEVVEVGELQDLVMDPLVDLRLLPIIPSSPQQLLSIQPWVLGHSQWVDQYPNL